MANSIEIRTAQQVTLSYDLASAGTRILATLIDGAVILLLLWVTRFILGGGLLAGWASFIILTFYHLVFESVLSGRSPGKMITGIRVMRTDGTPIGFADCFLRWIMRPLDITFSGGALGLFLILGSEKRQRLGDMMAGTAVISAKHSLHYSYPDLMRLHQKSPEQQITWPQLRHIEEKHILFIKNIINSRDDYSDEAHRKALSLCARKMASLLDMEKQPADERSFLQQIVNEYIILTR